MGWPPARPHAPENPLRARLDGLTLQDAYRLGQRLKRLKPDDAKARERLERDVERALERVEKRKAAVPAISYPDTLPVSARRDDLLAAIRDHQVVIVAGETGSGKTTQLPKICLELGRGIRGTIAHTQPRRLAARTVAERIADELKVTLGEAVGFAVRFSDQSREDTLLRLMTDGLLLAEIQRDRLLRRYDTIIIDEAHERSLNIDFLLGYLKRILPARPDLKVIVTSATIDPERFAAALRRRPDHRGLRAHLPGRGPLPRARRGLRPDRRDRRCRRGTAARAPRGHPRVPLRRARDPRHRRRARGPAALGHRDPPAVRAPVDRGAATGVEIAFQPPRGARHQRRRDLADRPRHPLRRRPRDRADLALQRAPEGPAAADRAGQPGVRRPAQGPLRAHHRRHRDPAVLRGELRRSARASPTRRSCARRWPR